MDGGERSLNGFVFSDLRDARVGGPCGMIERRNFWYASRSDRCRT